MSTEIFYVSLMHCGGCSGLIEDVVGEVECVESVVVDLESGRMEVVGEGFDRAEVTKMVEAAGRFKIVATADEVEHHVVPDEKNR